MSTGVDSETGIRAGGWRPVGPEERRNPEVMVDKEEGPPKREVNFPSQDEQFGRVSPKEIGVSVFLVGP